MLKRVFDIVFSAGALIVLSPLMVAVALWVKVDSPGPVFFRQRRVGLHGKTFEIYKFRSMRAIPQPNGLQITVGDDARITRSGAFIRKYKIDEFPQFLNVVLGHMSVVGPRPEVPRYVAAYPKVTRDTVLSVRPGITDLASVEYRDESQLLGASRDPETTYLETILPAKLRLCETYVRERSFLGDLRIIGRSFNAAFRRH